MKYQTEVKRGMELLDKLRPGWRAEIRVEHLALNCCFDCVLGQVFGDYNIGIKRLGLRSLDGDKYGFLPLHNSPEEYHYLQSAWENALPPAVNQ